MPNERLRALLLERGETPDKLAEAVQVDPKTVERWVTKGRIPYRAHRYAVAAFFGVDESYIWPDALGRDQVTAVSESEIVAVYPHRSEVPRDVWEHLFAQAEREIGVLVYSGLFLSEDARAQRIIKAKAGSGVRVRILEPARLWPVLVAVGLVAEGEDRCLDAVLQAEFGEDAADVGLDGLLADRQVPGDLPVAVTAGDQLEYFAFAR